MCNCLKKLLTLADIFLGPVASLLSHISGTMSRKEIEASYAISRRIEGEERALDAAVMVFTSTLQEVKDQWGLYDG